MSLGPLDALGVVGTVLGIVSFFENRFPVKDPEGTRVQIKAGLGDNDSDNLKGTIDNVYAYDFNNAYLGQSDECKIDEDGGLCEVTVDQKGPGIQADYVSIANGDDATCIAWVSVTQHDNSEGGAWSGDVGYHCGAPWYYGNQQAGEVKDSGELWRPHCTWLDGNHDNGYEHAAVKFTVRAFKVINTDDLESGVCDSSVFGPDNGPINGVPLIGATKRSVEGSRAVKRERRDWMKKRIIRSAIREHTAEELCNSETSYGPDFIGSDGMFCDMETKTLSPLCVTKDVDGCVVVPDNQAGQSMLAVRPGQVVKKYEKISTWQ